MQTSSIKIEKSEKEKLEILQAKLRLEKNLSLDQYQILGKLIDYALDHFEEVNFLSEESIFLSVEEIADLEKDILVSAKEYELDKSDDELLYGA